MFTPVSRLGTDDSMSGASVSDVNDRLAALELRVQQQEDELTVMKAALADVLRRLDASEISAASSTKKQHAGKSKQHRNQQSCSSSLQFGFNRMVECDKTNRFNFPATNPVCYLDTS